MNWTKEDEVQVYREYLLMIDALCNTEEFESEWKGQWESFHTEAFNGRKVTIKGDKEKYMTYWVENQKIINDPDWDKIDNNTTTYDEDY